MTQTWQKKNQYTWTWTHSQRLTYALMASYVDRMQLARAFVNSSGEVVVKLPSSPVFLVLSDPLLLASLDACSDTHSHAHKGGGGVRKLQANHSNPVYQQLCTHSVGHQAHAMVQVGTWDVQIQKFHSSILVTVPHADTAPTPETTTSLQEVQNAVAALTTQLYAAVPAADTRHRKRLCSSLE